MRIIDKGSSQRAVTKDGYLVVPATISKTGIFDYHAQELNLNDKGVKKVARTENSLFTDRTLKSFEGAPITLGHPKGSVNADNWKALSVGVVRNVKREDDTLTGEAWIYDGEAIRLVQDHGIDELSCGYDCAINPATGNNADFEMSPMIGNHVAIVAKGRCGSSVKLADEGTIMSKTIKFLDSLLGVFGVTLSDEQKKKVEEKENEPETDAKANVPVKAKEKPTSPPTDDDDEKEPEKEKTKVKDEALMKEHADLKAELQQMKDAQAKSNSRHAALADALSSFPDMAFADGDSARQIQEKVILDQHIHTADELKTLSDEAVLGAYGVAKKLKAHNVNDAVGKALLKDAQPQIAGFDFNSYKESK